MPNAGVSSADQLLVSLNTCTMPVDHYLANPDNYGPDVTLGTDVDGNPYIVTCDIDSLLVDEDE
jgi:hypothetical protein